MGNITTLRYLSRIKRVQVKAKQMKRLNNFLPFGVAAAIALTSCSTSFNAMKGGETDDLYFMASDARVATEFAVRNNNPENFRSFNSLTQESFQQENFSARNVNPEYIARYSEQTVQDNETVYFDDAETQSAPNVNVYNNFYGAGANGMGWNQPRMNFNLGLGFGFGGGMWGNPWMMPGMGWGGMGMMGMGMWDPFWDPFWPGMGFGPGFGWGMRPGWGLGWNSMWGMNAGFGWGGMGMWGNPWMRPGFGWGGGMWGPGWGWGGPGLIIVNPGWGGAEGQRRIVRGARPGTGASMAPGYRGGATTGAPATARAARRDAASGTNAYAPNNRVNSNRDFARSQNDLYSNRSRVATAPNAGNRTTSSAAATRPSRNSAVNSANPAYTRAAGNRGSAVNPSAARGNNTGFNNRSAMPANRSASPSYNRTNTRSASPSYNRGTTNSFQRQAAPSRSSGMSAPSNRSSSFGSAPSRSSGASSGGFSSGGGGMRSGGGGVSSGGGGGSRGGRGN